MCKKQEQGMSVISSLGGPAAPTFKIATDKTPPAASRPDNSSPVLKQADDQDQQTNQPPSVPPSSSGKVLSLVV
jgi:hypothetical protein